MVKCALCVAGDALGVELGDIDVLKLALGRLEATSEGWLVDEEEEEEEDKLLLSSLVKVATNPPACPSPPSAPRAAI